VIHSIGLLITIIALALRILVIIIVLALLLSYFVHCLQTTPIDLELGTTTPRVY
jgi:antibiotic biosynthesis monooxygenase (ABM) superfamily enzyme